MERNTESVSLRSKNAFFQKQNGWRLLMAVLLCAQMALVLYYGGQKAGFHEDEFYSYYSTNRTAGLYEPDREWVERDAYRNEFVVLEGEGFRYGLVAQVQSWDVHPPFFYFLLHTVCSVFPGVFSKWLGIGVNLLAFILNFFLLTYLTYLVTGKNRALTALVSAANGFNVMAISGVLFIRMYEWLTLFVLLCACLHVRAMQKGSENLQNRGSLKNEGSKDKASKDKASKDKGSKDKGLKPGDTISEGLTSGDLKPGSFYLPLMVTTYLGFLTQYYYLIFLFFMGMGFSFYLVFVKKRPGEFLRYGFSQGAALVLAVCSYPASLSHIFRGYRGTGAVSEFMNAANTGERLRFFWGLMNTYVFNGYLWLFLLLIVGLGIWMLLLKKREGNLHYWGRYYGRGTYFLLLFSVCGYFFTVSKTALLLYETSNRYQLPVYGMVMLLVITALYGLGSGLLRHYGGTKGVGTVCFIALTVAFLLTDLQGILKGRVLFLYREEKERMACAKENRSTPVVILYNDATPYHVWWCADELMEYDRVYFASEGNPERITDEILCSGERLIVYAADGENREKHLRMLLEENPRLKECRLLATKQLWRIYELK